MDRGVFVLLLFVGICQYVQCQPLPTCPGKEGVVTTCEAFPQECDRDSDCKNGQSCCQYGCGRRMCYSPNIVKDICSLPSETGPCRAAFRRWFYNKKTRQCERFIFGGCRGNKNNFKTEQECEKRCERRPFNPCKVGRPRPDIFCGRGPGRMPCPRGTTCIISPIDTYAVCCPVVPDVPVDTCSLPKVVGPCKAAMRRWYFNKSTGRCLRFTYGGCQGNKNNFSSRRACNRRCGRHRRYRPVIKVA